MMKPKGVRELFLKGLGCVSVAGMGAFSGCGHVATSEATGRSSFQLVRAAPTPSTASAQMAAGVATLRDTVTDAQPIEPLAKAIYPKVARGAKLGVVTIAVRITIDTEGRVVDVAPSLTHLALPSRFSREFQEAVETALAQWRFMPSEVKHMEEAPGAEGGTYLRLVRREKIEARGDVVFTFSEDGAVWSGLRAK